MKRRLAKLLYWVSGKLTKIKTPRMTYRLVSFDPFVTEPAGKRWLACRTSHKMLKWSMRLDWDHWDHWACIHDHCAKVCQECGGWVCGEDRGEWTRDEDL